MQLTFRRNPKTPDGWPKRIAIALLIGAAAMLLTSPVAFFALLSHYQSTTPNDTQNVLGALTLSVVLGLGISAFCAVTSLVIGSFFRLIKPAPGS